jgi:hypothetical protein
MTARLGPRIDAALGSVATTEGRLAATAGILLLTVAVGWLLLPRLVRAGERVTADRLERFLNGRGESSLETFREAVPVSFGLRLLVSFSQLALFALAAVAVLRCGGGSWSSPRPSRSRRTSRPSPDGSSSRRCCSAAPTSRATC